MKIFNFIKNINNQTKVSNDTSKGFEETKNNLPSLNTKTLTSTQTSSQFELLQLSAQERVNLIKELLSLPKDLKGLSELLETLMKNNKLDLTKFKELISQHSKQGLNKLISINTISLQNGVTPSKETQEIMGLLAAISIPSKATPEILKEIINIYVPITNPKEFEVQIEQKGSENKGNDKDSYVSFLIESKELGLFFTEIFKEENNVICLLKTTKDNENLVNNIKNKIDDNVQINFIESKQETKEELQNKIIFFKNNVADLNILNFMFNLIGQIYLQANRKTA